MLGRDEKALAAADRAATVDPRSAGAHKMRGIILQAMGRHGEGDAALKEAARCKSGGSGADGIGGQGPA